MNENSLHNKELLEIRFRKKFIVESITKCWIWIGAKYDNEGNYGRIKVDRKYRPAHKISAYLFLNFDLDSNLKVLHKCDNKMCVNPDHLFIGSQQDNMTDMVNKKRQAYGEKNGHSILKEEDVLDIIILYCEGWDRKQLKEKYNVSFGCIDGIILGRNWKHLN